MSRILSGSAQEPKLRLAYDLAKALGVTLDYLVDDSLDPELSNQLVMVSEDEQTILKIVRRLGCDASMGRLLGMAATPLGGEPEKDKGLGVNSRTSRAGPDRTDQP